MFCNAFLVLQVKCVMFCNVFVEPACGKGRHSCYNFRSVYVRASGFVRAITSIFMHGFQNNSAQLLSLRRKSGS